MASACWPNRPRFRLRRCFAWRWGSAGPRPFSASCMPCSCAHSLTRIRSSLRAFTPSFRPCRAAACIGFGPPLPSTSISSNTPIPGKIWMPGFRVASTSPRTEPVRATASYVTGGLFDALGVKPARGRVLNGQDDQPGAPLTAVIGYGLWQRAFGGDPNITGKDILFNNEKCTVIGVMPPGFEFPPGEVDATEIRSPLQSDPAKLGGLERTLSVFARTPACRIEPRKRALGDGATGHALRANRLAEDAHVFEGSAPDRHVSAAGRGGGEPFGPRCGPCSARLASFC